MALSNRYPAPQRAAPVRQSRPVPAADNDNRPGPRPANDNRPGGRPRLPKDALGQRAARGLAARAAAGALGAGFDIGALLGGGILAALLLNMILRRTASSHLVLNGWNVDFTCKAGSGQWISGNPSGCVNRQFGLSPYPTAAALIAATPGVLHINDLLGPYKFLGVDAWDLAVNYSRASATPESDAGPQQVPNVHVEDLPWPENWPLPDVDTFPVGMPYPIRAPAVRGSPAGSVHSSRTSGSIVSTTYPPEPARWPRRPRKGEKERKLRGGKGLLAIIGGGLGTWSEMNDFVESLWDALPKELQTKGANIGDKYNDLYEHLGDVDFSKAVENLVKNQIEDEIIGRLIGRANKVLGHNAVGGVRRPHLGGFGG